MHTPRHTPGRNLPRTGASPRTLAALGVAGFALTLAACSSGESAERPDPRPVALDAFRGDRPQAAPTPVEPAEPPASAREPEAPDIVVVRGDTTAPAVSPAATAALASGEPILLDAKIGDLNGRPIYANDFFEPIAARLSAEAQRLPEQQWMRLAAQTIDRQLQGQLTDELLRGEALSTLSTEQRQGLRAFLDTIRDNVVSQNLGSQRLAERRLREQTGGSLDDFLREREELELVRLSLLTDVYRRINVSWRDIRQRYEADSDRFNPPPTAVFRLIRVRTANAERVSEVAERLASGEPFEAIAESEVNSFNPDGGGAQAATFDEGTFGETAFFGPEVLNEAAWGLREGEWAGPIEFGSQTGWLLLERIERVSVSLYDAQLTIQDELTLERREEELQRYVERLIERSRVDNLDELRNRLIEIATDRYGPRS